MSGRTRLTELTRAIACLMRWRNAGDFSKPYSFASCSSEAIIKLLACGRRRWARSAPSRASGLWSGRDGRACISSMATLLFGSSLAWVQTTPIASSSSAFASADIEARAREVCEPDFVCATTLEKQIQSKSRFTQRRKVKAGGTKEDGDLLFALC